MLDGVVSLPTRLVRYTSKLRMLDDQAGVVSLPTALMLTHFGLGYA